MKILIDMNLSPSWVALFLDAGIEARHWSAVGAPDASDKELFDWAKSHGYTVFTHDLDFGSILSATNASGPSVVQIRAQDVSPSVLGPEVIRTLRRFEKSLTAGALITVEKDRARARILPLSLEMSSRLDGQPENEEEP